MRRVRVTPRLLRHGMNLWPTFLFSGVRIVSIADDWTRVEVRLRVKGLNRNYVGTAFGGTLFAMGDPFYMLMALHQLGEGYIVWDASAEIDFVSPGTGTVTGVFELTRTDVEAIRAATATGQKHLVWFTADLLGEDGRVVARTRRQLYVRRKR